MLSKRELRVESLMSQSAALGQREKVLAFTYWGHPRIVEPHAVGVSAAGHTALHCFWRLS